ncbi:AcrR family transcriptional regulator [Catenulispora sp. GP43]|uniref:TetR/AcrR family transcriptional regulator n=1 Tax=Catenulispora sp. GP43 TaxID=3156263 RepID=UPI003511C118
MPTDQRDRRALLADAAIDLLAEEGMRALTHRAVDTRAALPLGTTSAYFRTRQALLTAIVKRLSDLDREDLRRGGLDLPSQPAVSEPKPRPEPRPEPKPRREPAGSEPKPEPAAPVAPAAPTMPADLAAVAEATAAFIDLSLSRTRNRALARYHCRMESITQPDLRALLAPHEQAAFRQTRDLLAHHGVPDLDSRARAFVAAVDGLIFERLVGGSPETPGTAENRAELTKTVRALLAGATAR